MHDEQEVQFSLRLSVVREWRSACRWKRQSYSVYSVSEMQEILYGRSGQTENRKGSGSKTCEPIKIELAD